MEKLVDIKDFVKVDDSSLYLFSSLVILGVLVAGFMLWKVISHFKNRKKSQRQIAREALLSLEFTDSKQASYKVSKFAPFLIQNDAQKELLQDLLKELEKYKYQKTVPPMDEQDKNKIKMFMEACDV